MSYDIILGVDPGVHGALALVDRAGRLLTVDDVPSYERKRGKRMVTEISLPALAQLVEAAALHHTLAYFERVGARPGQGVSSMFAFGRATGQIEGMLASVGIPVIYVPPLQWRKGVQAGEGKGGSRDRAQALFPGDRSFFARAKDDGRADAALIAWWGSQQQREAS